MIYKKACTICFGLKSWQKQNARILKNGKRNKTKWAKKLAQTKNGNSEKTAKNAKMAILGKLFWFVHFQIYVILQILSIWFPVRLSKVWLDDKNCELKFWFTKKGAQCVLTRKIGTNSVCAGSIINWVGMRMNFRKSDRLGSEIHKNLTPNGSHPSKSSRVHCVSSVRSWENEGFLRVF